MTVQEKAEALNALGGLQIHIRNSGDWYCTFGRLVMISGDGIQRGWVDSCPTPDAAIAAAWTALAQLEKPELYVSVEGSGLPRRNLRWAGFMWRGVPTLSPTAPKTGGEGR